MARVRLEDFDDEPDPGCLPPPTPVHSLKVEEFLSKIEKMLSCGRWEWTHRTLVGIQDTVRAAGYVTTGQRQAVQNIYNGARRKSPACYTDFDEEDLDENPQGSRRRTTGGVYRSIR